MKGGREEMSIDMVLWSRFVIGMILGFYVIFVMIGVGVFFMIVIVEFVGICKKDNYYILMVKRWLRGFVIFVVVGVVIGMVILL